LKIGFAFSRVGSVKAPELPSGAFRHGVARDLLAAKAQMVKLCGGRPQACFDIAQTFPPGQPRERQAAEPIEAGKALDLAIPIIPCHAPAGNMQLMSFFQ
jgi:hypothetical protein